MNHEKVNLQNDRHSFIHKIWDISLIGAPLFFLISEIVHPESQAETAWELASVATYHTQWYLAHIAALFAIIMVPFAIQGLLRFLKNSYYSMGYIGSILISMGTVALSGLLAFDIITLVMAENSSREIMIGLYDRITQTPGFSLIFMTIGPLLLVIGMLLLAVLLFASKAVRRWQSISFGIGIFLYGFAGPVFAVDNGVLIVISGAVLMLAGLGFIGLMDLINVHNGTNKIH